MLRPTNYPLQGLALNPVTQSALRRRAEDGRLDVKLGWFHRYPARFAPDVAEAMFAGVIVRTAAAPGLVMDPFAGTGATMAAARQLGMASIGVELSQLGMEIARLRLDPPADIDSALALVIEWSQSSTPTTSNLNPELATWLAEDNSAALTGYLERLAAVEDPAVARFARVAISQALRPSSRWLAGSVKVTADPSRTPPPIGMHLRRWARVMAADCRTEQHLSSSAGNAPASILGGDACRLPVESGVVDAIITSPPYFITYDYFEVNRLSYLTFGWSRPRAQQVGMRYGHALDGAGFVAPDALAPWYAAEFGGERQGLGRALRVYCQRMSLHLDESYRVLRRGGVMAYAVANSTRRGRPFDLTTGISQLMTQAGFEEVEICARSLGDTRILPPSRDVDTGRFASVGQLGVTESIVYARKG